MNQNMTDKSNRPFVFVRCITYNHEPFIEDALKGFAMQKTDFPFLAVVIDDCSTDGTADIVRRYEAQYPDKIKGIYLPHNFHQTKEDKRPYYQEYIDKATYWAECEGDDYWTDPLKLQKQVDFLEAHPEYSLCFHEVKVYDQRTKQFEENTITRDVPGESDITELAKGNYIHTPSVLVRYDKEVYSKLKSMGRIIPSDYVLWMLYAEKGKLYKLPEEMAVYRVGSGMWSTSRTLRNDMLYLCALNKLYTYIEDQQARANMQLQINGIIDTVVHMEHDYNQINQSKAYRFGKMLLRPFRLFKKRK
jgi:glycosyltransferase involved in cell wall biosynthesis